jgi:hypothetical protein
MEVFHHENLFHLNSLLGKAIEDFVSRLCVMRTFASPEVFRVIFVGERQKVVFFAFGVFHPDLPVDIEFDFVFHFIIEC